MKSKTIAIWGCGRIGQEVVRHVINHGHKVLWCRDSQLPKAALVAQELKAQFLPEVPIPEHHPKVDIIIDATGDVTLLNYWKIILKRKVVKNVILTRREPLSDLQIMAGLPEDIPELPEEKIISMGSCTGNAWVPFAAQLTEKFTVQSMACRVLHPLKQDKIKELRLIPTALWKSFNDHRPQLSKKFTASSMEIPVDRGMALDFSIVFENTITKEEIEEYLFEIIEKNSKLFSLATQEPTNKSIINDPHSWVLGPNWTITEGKLMTGLLWQDNEGGYAARIIDVLEHIT